MLSLEQVEEFLLCPIKIEIICDSDEFKIAVQNLFTELINEHNKKHKQKIDHIVRHQYREDVNNECRIFVGKEVVQYIKCPKINNFGAFDKLSQNILDFCSFFATSIEQMLDLWHEKMVEIQEENKIKIKGFQEENYNEMLYAYYSVRSDPKAFQYLKKLAIRYPNSKYMVILRRTYRFGLYGQRKNANLADKLQKYREKKNVF